MYLILYIFVDGILLPHIAILPSTSPAIARTSCSCATVTAKKLTATTPPAPATTIHVHHRSRTAAGDDGGTSSRTLTP